MAFNEGDILRLAAVFNHAQTGEQVNVWYARITGLTVGTVGAIEQDIQDMMDDLYDGIIDYTSDNVEGARIEVRNLTEGVVYGPWLFDPPFVGGSAASGELPSGNTALLVARTGVPRRIGRKYMPVATIEGIAGGDLTTGYHTALLTVADRWYGGFVGSTLNSYEFVVCEADGSNPLVITNTAVIPEPAYQRRRKRGRGS